MAAQMLGVCIKTVRRWDKQSKIKSFRTIGNHRRFTIQEIKRVLTRSNEKEGKSVDSSLKRCALYGRVSSHEQKKRGDLDSQIKALEHYCREKKYMIYRAFTMTVRCPSQRGQMSPFVQIFRNGCWEN